VKEEKTIQFKRMKMQEVAALVAAPLNEELRPEERTESCLVLSDLVVRMVTHVICHVIVDYEAQLQEERLSVANAFLQRVTSTHLCNHKLTREGITFEYNGQAFDLHEEYKTMTLTRSVYEHLVMFYFLFAHPKSAEERSVVWNYWKINSKKNLLESLSRNEEGGKRNENSSLRSKAAEPSVEAEMEIEALRQEIFATETGRICKRRLDEWTRIGKPTQNGCIEFYRENGRLEVRRVSYNQAWKYLFDKEGMTLLYRHLSMHCHPIYNGLLQYQTQAESDEGYDGMPLYLSCCFLTHLCKLFLRLIPGGNKMLRQAFSEQERYVFNTLSQLPDE
jgi:hypothetical protein